MAPRVNSHSREADSVNASDEEYPAIVDLTNSFPSLFIEAIIPAQFAEGHEPGVGSLGQVRVRNAELRQNLQRSDLYLALIRHTFDAPLISIGRFIVSVSYPAIFSIQIQMS